MSNSEEGPTRPRPAKARLYGVEQSRRRDLPDPSSFSDAELCAEVRRLERACDTFEAYRALLVDAGGESLAMCQDAIQKAGGLLAWLETPSGERWLSEWGNEWACR